MKNIIYLYFFCCAFLNSGTAQILWLKGENTLTEFTFINNIDGFKLDLNKNGKTLNFHPLFISNPDQLTFALDAQQLDQCQIYSVYFPSSSKQEEVIWKLSTYEKDFLALTSARMVDFRTNKFINFIDQQSSEPQINVYHHAKKQFPQASFIIGSKFINENIPVNKLEGSLAEVIVFDRVLAPIAQQKIESYLSIKYSLPLANGRDYIDGNGKTIRSYHAHKDFFYNLGGLGNDQKTTLDQRQSQTSLSEGYIAIGLDSIYEFNFFNPNKLESGEFILWGDNNKNVYFHQDINTYSKLNREWKFTNTLKADQRLLYRVDHPSLKQNLLPSESVWIKVKSAHSSEVQYVRLETHENILQGNIIAKNGIQTLSLIKAPEFWFDPIIEYADCAEDSGKISLTFVGGKAPFHVKLYDKITNVLKQSIITKERSLTFKKLGAASYSIIAVDLNSNRYDQDIYISNSDIEIEAIELIKASDAQLKINHLLLEKYQPDILWTLPTKMTSNQQAIPISKGGIYTLEVKIDGCTYYDMVDIPEVNSNIETFEVMPTLSVDGNIQVKAQFKEPAPFQITITDISGKIISATNYHDDQFIDLNDHIAYKGLFIVSMITGHEVQSQKIIVK